MFENVKTAPPDAILGLTETFKADTNPDKINLTVGVYQDADGKTPIFDVVKAAEKKRIADETNKAYMPMTGDPTYGKAVQQMMLGEDHPIISGAMNGATGQSVAKGLKYTYHALAKATSPLGIDLRGLYAGDRLVGVYSPRDVMVSQAGLRAFGSIGYDVTSAQKVAENIMLYATTLGAAPSGDPAE